LLYTQIVGEQEAFKLELGSSCPDQANLCTVRASPTRDALRNAIKSLEAASTELTEAQVPEQRLLAIVRELETVEGELTACHAEDERALGTWLAVGADGERPQPSVRTLAAERTVAALGRDAAAARSALLEHQTKVQLCAERVRDLGIARREVAYKVAVEAVREFLDREFRPAIQRLLAFEAKARSVERALRDLGNGADPSSLALGCSVEVAEAIRAAKAAERVPHDHETGKRLIDRLVTNAEASLEEDRQD
jgi:hypothetical protein